MQENPMDSEVKFPRVFRMFYWRADVDDYVAGVREQLKETTDKTCELWERIGNMEGQLREYRDQADEYERRIEESRLELEQGRQRLRESEERLLAAQEQQDRLTAEAARQSEELAGLNAQLQEKAEQLA